MRDPDPMFDHEQPRELLEKLAALRACTKTSSAHAKPRAPLRSRARERDDLPQRAADYEASERSCRLPAVFDPERKGATTAFRTDARMAELADALDLGSSVLWTCRFESCSSH